MVGPKSAENAAHQALTMRPSKAAPNVLSMRAMILFSLRFVQGRSGRRRTSLGWVGGGREGGHCASMHPGGDINAADPWRAPLDARCAALLRRSELAKGSPSLEVELTLSITHSDTLLPMSEMAHDGCRRRGLGRPRAPMQEDRYRLYVPPAPKRESPSRVLGGYFSCGWGVGDRCN